VQTLVLSTKGHRQHGIFDRQRGDPRRLELFHRAHDVQRVSVSVIRVHHEGQIASTGDASNLLGELRQRQDDEIRRPEDGPRGDRSGEHSHLEPE